MTQLYSTRIFAQANLPLEKLGPTAQGIVRALGAQPVPYAGFVWFSFSSAAAIHAQEAQQRAA